MARITVEDCLSQIPNRFHLVVTAAKRARKLAMGHADSLVPWENDKPTVVALREIAAGLLPAMTGAAADAGSDTVADGGMIEH